MTLISKDICIDKLDDINYLKILRIGNMLLVILIEKKLLENFTKNICKK